MTNVRTIMVPADDWADLETLTTPQGVIATGSEAWLQNTNPLESVLIQYQAAKPTDSKGWLLQPAGQPDCSTVIPAGKPKVWLRATGKKPVQINAQKA